MRRLSQVIPLVLGLAIATAGLTTFAHDAAACDRPAYSWDIELPSEPIENVPIEGAIVLEAVAHGPRLDRIINSMTVTVQDENGVEVQGALNVVPLRTEYAVEFTTHDRVDFLLVWQAGHQLSVASDYTMRLEFEESYTKYQIDEAPPSGTVEFTTRSDAAPEPTVPDLVEPTVEIVETSASGSRTCDRSGNCPDCEFDDMGTFPKVTATLPKPSANRFVVHQLATPEVPTLERTARVWDGGDGPREATLYFANEQDEYCLVVVTTHLGTGATAQSNPKCIGTGGSSEDGDAGEESIDAGSLADVSESDGGSSGGSSGGEDDEGCTTITSTPAPVGAAIVGCLICIGFARCRRRPR